MWVASPRAGSSRRARPPRSGPSRAARRARFERRATSPAMKNVGRGATGASQSVQSRNHLEGAGFDATMKHIICKETSRLGQQLYRDRLRAVVLTGSLARNEGTFIEGTGGCRLHGDAEFL